MSPAARPPLRIAIAGLGAIGFKLAQALDAGIPGLTLTAVAASDPERAKAKIAGLRAKPAIAAGPNLAGFADIVVDAAPSANFRPLAEATIGAGRILMTVNAGALLSNLDLVDVARQTGGRIIVPTGALLGLDAVRAAAEGTIKSATMITRKPPRGLEGAPLQVKNKIELADN
jgi:aspartate dehydrogenase